MGYSVDMSRAKTEGEKGWLCNVCVSTNTYCCESTYAATNLSMLPLLMLLFSYTDTQKETTRINTHTITQTRKHTNAATHHIQRLHGRERCEGYKLRQRRQVHACDKAEVSGRDLDVREGQRRYGWEGKVLEKLINDVFQGLPSVHSSVHSRARFPPHDFVHSPINPLNVHSI